VYAQRTPQVRGSSNFPHKDQDCPYCEPSAPGLRRRSCRLRRPGVRDCRLRPGLARQPGRWAAGRAAGRDGTCCRGCLTRT